MFEYKIRRDGGSVYIQYSYLSEPWGEFGYRDGSCGEVLTDDEHLEDELKRLKSMYGRFNHE